MAILTPQAKYRVFSDSGVIGSGFEMSVFEAGTTTPKDTFTDSTGTQANDNPIVFNAFGEADIWLTDGEFYKFELRDAQGALQWTVDNISGSGSSGGITQGVVSTIAELKALEVTDFLTVQVLGYFTANDGGGGLFTSDLNSVEVDNGGTIFRPDSLPAQGRWVRVFSGNVSLEYFGAIGDYIVDGLVNGSATDNTITINSTFTYANANGLGVRVPSGAFLVSGSLNCTTSMVGDKKGRIEGNHVYGDPLWNSGAPANLSGSCIVWDTTVLTASDFYLKNVAGEDSRDIKFENITFYSLSDGGAGGGKLLENKLGNTGTQYYFGELPTFLNCHIVNFGTALTVGNYNSWIVSDVVFKGCATVMEAGNDTPEQAVNIALRNCSIEFCGVVGTPIFKLDNVTGFLFDNCAFSQTSEIELRICTGQGLTFENCFFGALQATLDDFITVTSTAGFDVDNITITGCLGGGVVGNINLIQGANIASLVIKDSAIIGAEIALGSDNVRYFEFGNVLTDGTTGGGDISTLSSNGFTDSDIIFEKVSADKYIRTDGNGNRLNLIGGSSLTSADSANIILEGSGQGGSVEINSTTGSAKGNINLNTDNIKKVAITGTLEATGPTNGSLTVSGGVGIAKSLFALGGLNTSSVLNVDGDTDLGGNLDLTGSGKGISINTSGGGATAGSITVSGTGTTQVNTTSVQTSSIILITMQGDFDFGGADASASYSVDSIVNGSNFKIGVFIDSVSKESRTVHWLIINPT